MMNTYRICLLVAAALVFLISACRGRMIEIDSLEKEIFLGENREGVYRNGTPLFRFSEEHHQKAFNPSRLQYRIQTDEQDTCLNVTLDALPRSTGLHITTSIDYRSPGDLISSMTHLECSRINGDKLWLWSPESLTGIIIDISGLK